MPKILSAYERETIITFNEAEAEASIFTYDRRWQQHLEKNLGIKPKFNNDYGGKEYKIDKKRISMPRTPRRLSAETKARMAANLAQLRAKKQAATKKLEGVGQKGIPLPKGEKKDVKNARSYALEAERKMGQLLQETERQKPGEHWGKKRLPDVTVTPTLAELGITKRESSDAQELAELPDEQS